MKRLHAVSVLMLACAVPAPAAEKLAPLDADFLEYLASFGGDEENWVLFADEEPATRPPPQEPAAKRGESSKEAADKPAEKQ